MSLDVSARRAVFATSLVLVFGALIARLAELQIVEHAHFEAASRANRIRLIPVAAPRGLIVDREGRVLARSRPSYVCAMIPSAVNDLDMTIRRLSRTLDIPASALRANVFRHQGTTYDSFDAIVANEPYGPLVLASELTTTQAARLAESLPELPGIDLEAQPIRDYPFKSMGSHLFGYVGEITEDDYAHLRGSGYSPDDVVGKDGLEAQYESVLHGRSGGRQIAVDARGFPVDALGIRPATPGTRLQLTIDWRLQELAENALHTQLAIWSKRTHRRLAGAVVIEDARDGGILALASQPNFDPNAFAAGIGERRFARYLADGMHPLYNRAIAAATATGSTFKLVTGAAAISEHLINPAARVYDSGTYACHGTVFRDLAAGGLGMINFTQALAGSSDGYFYHVADLLGHERLRRYARDFGLGERSGIDLPGEFAGNWPTNAWSMRVYHVPLEPSDVCQLGIGQGAMEATPLQMANVTAVIANGGTLYRPHLVANMVSPDGAVRHIEPQAVHQVPISAQAVAAVRAGMAGVTGPGGTAAGYTVPGLPYGGKTGTVETDGGHGPNTTWFVAFAPLDHPRIALAVYMERSGNYGASVAVPVAQHILAGYERLRAKSTTGI